METKILDEQKQVNSSHDLVQAREDSNKRMNLSSEKPFEWLNENSRKFLAAGYIGEGYVLAERIANIAKRAEEILQMPGYAEKFYYYMSEGFYSLASPVWSNFGKKRGLPISCFGSHIDDDIGNILYSQSEVGMMSKLGGGTSGYFGKIRHRGAAIKDNGEASGAVHIMRLFESMVDVVSQGSVRRGPFLHICQLITQILWNS